MMSAEKVEAARRFGRLTLWNPMQPDGASQRAPLPWGFRQVIRPLTLAARLHPGYYSLDLSREEDNAMAGLLVQPGRGGAWFNSNPLLLSPPLAHRYFSRAAGENWIAETYDKGDGPLPGWELLASWAQAIPIRGKLTLTYTSDSGDAWMCAELGAAPRAVSVRVRAAGALGRG